MISSSAHGACRYRGESLPRVLRARSRRSARSGGSRRSAPHRGDRQQPGRTARRPRRSPAAIPAGSGPPRGVHPHEAATFDAAAAAAALEALAGARGSGRGGRDRPRFLPGFLAPPRPGAGLRGAARDCGSARAAGLHARARRPPPVRRDPETVPRPPGAGRAPLLHGRPRCAPRLPRPRSPRGDHGLDLRRAPWPAPARDRRPDPDRVG